MQWDSEWVDPSWRHSGGKSGSDNSKNEDDKGL